jgi:hypothetical protein
MARWGRPLLRCTVSVVCAEGELTVGVFKTSDQIQKGPSAEQAHRQIILYISRYINIDSYCPCPVAWHAKHPFWRIDEPCTTPLLSSFDLNCKPFLDIYTKLYHFRLVLTGKENEQAPLLVLHTTLPFASTVNKVA